AGDGSAAPRNTGGVGAKRAVAIERTARAPPRPAAAGVDVAALLAAASGTALSVRSMKSAPSSVSPLTASRTASRTPLWSASEALSVTSLRGRVIVAGSASPARPVGGPRKVPGASPMLPEPAIDARAQRLPDRACDDRAKLADRPAEAAARATPGRRGDDGVGGRAAREPAVGAAYAHRRQRERLHLRRRDDRVDERRRLGDGDHLARRHHHGLAVHRHLDAVDQNATRRPARLLMPSAGNPRTSAYPSFRRFWMRAVKSTDWMKA